MRWLDREFPGPYIVLAQGDKDDQVALVLAKVEGGTIKRLGLRRAPSPYSARRMGLCPGRTGS